MRQRQLCACAHGPSGRAFPLPGDPLQYAPDRGFVVTAMVLRVELDLEKKRVVGDAELAVRRVDREARTLALDAVAFDLTRVERDGAAAAFSYDGRVLSVDLAAVPVDGTTTVRVVYAATPRRGLYFLEPDAKVPARPRQVWTQGQDEDNRHWMPCQDHPGMRLSTDVHVTVPRPLTAIGNGRLVARTPSADGTRETFHWSQRAPHAPYLVMLAVGEFDEATAEAAGVPLSYHVPRGAGAHIERSLGRTPRMVELFTQKLGAYPWDKYAQVVVSDFIFGGMENTSATILFDRVLLDERAVLDVDMDAIVAHELAHQWFGDLLTCREWTHGWLNEGFATFFEHVWREHAEGRDAYLYGLLGDLDTYLDESQGRYERPIVTNHWAAPIDLFDRHLYEKGGLVLHALRAHLGEDAFWRGIRAYVDTHRGRAVETRDLVRALEAATGRSLERFFDERVMRSGHPDLVVGCTHDKGLLQVSVTQKNCDANDATTWRSLELPVVVATESGVERHVLPVTRPRETFTLPCAVAPVRVSIDPELHVFGGFEDERATALVVAELAGGPTSLTRARAARALGKRNEVQAEDALARGLAADGFWGVRAECAHALGEQRSERALDILLAAAPDADPRVRRAVVRALGEWRNTRAADALLGGVQAGDASWMVEAELLRALGRTRDARAYDVLVAALARDSYADVLRAAALDGLVASRDPRALDHALAFATYGHHAPARRAALAGLGVARERTSDAVKLAAVREVLADQLGDFDPTVKISALSALVALRQPEALAAIERSAERELDARTRRRAREASRDLRAALGEGAESARLRDELDKVRDETRALRDRLAKLEAQRDPA